MSAGIDDKAGKDSLAQRQKLLVAQGRGDMVSENLDASQRFKRNSQALQAAQAARTEARSEQGQDKPLTFGEGRGKAQAPLKPNQEHAVAVTKGQEQEKSAVGKDKAPEKELSFGADRRRKGLEQLKQEHANAEVKDKGKTEKDLPFGPGRNGQDQSKDGPGHPR